jgi:hypothetical protein
MGESAEDGEIKSGDLSTDLGHTNYVEGEVELLGWRYFLSIIKIYWNRFSKRKCAETSDSMSVITGCQESSPGFNVKHEEATLVSTNI